MPPVVITALRSLPRASRRLHRRIFRLRMSLRLAATAVLLLGLFFAANWLYQVIRKPAELLAPLGAGLGKTPQATWTAYGALFREHATPLITPDLLAALAQVEGSGNPLAWTDWRWQWSPNPVALYRPASSAVGMFQMTDATFAEARRYCIHDHAVVEAGRWYDLGACWFNGLYSRVVPSHAIELTAAYLHRSVEEALERARMGSASLEQRRTLAAVAHLCGKQRAVAVARHGFRPRPGERCGDHDLGRYLDRVRHLRREFARLAG